MEINAYNRNRALIVTVIVHVTVLLLMLMSFKGCIRFEDLETANGGVMVSFGELDAGGGDMTPEATDTQEEQVQESEPVEETQPDVDDPVVTNDQSDVAVPKKTEPKQPEKKTEPVKKKPTINPELKKKLDKLKQLGKGNKDGESGDGRKPGKQGDPNAENDGPGGTGRGKVGAGTSLNLSGFGHGDIPAPVNESQEFGVVKLDFCLDRYGRFIGEPTIAPGSKTSNAYLVRITKEAIMRVKFTPTGNVSNTNCGTYTVTYARK